MKERVLARDIARHVNSSVSIQGWLHKERKLGGLNFIVVRDRSGLVQVLIEDKAELKKLDGLYIGTVLEIEGSVVEDERAPGGAEIHEPKINIVVPVKEVSPIEIDKPIDHKPENHDTLFEYRPLNLRNPQEQLIFKIRAATLGYIREWLNDNEFVEIQTPKLLAGATEGGAEVFKLDYFDQEAFLAQSPQLYKQMMVGVFERVFEIGQAYRAEPSMTSRHLSEISMLDVEFGFVESLDDVLNVAESLVSAALKKLWAEHADELKKLGATEPKLTDKFPRMTLAEVHEGYSKETGEDTIGEKDLAPAEERWASEYASKKWGSEAVFVTEWPASEMKFYHMADENNPELAARADLIFRGVELATIPLREYRYERVVEQMKVEGMDINNPGYRYFLMAMRHGLPPHGGFGFGVDRFVQLIVGLKNVKEATLFPRDMNRLAP